MPREPKKTKHAQAKRKCVLMIGSYYFATDSAATAFTILGQLSKLQALEWEYESNSDGSYYVHTQPPKMTLEMNKPVYASTPLAGLPSPEADTVRCPSCHQADVSNGKKCAACGSLYLAD
jgi:hypothetical protein